MNSTNVCSNEKSTVYSRLSGATRSRRADKYARQREASKAMRLYALDNAAARRGERPYPQVSDYTAWTWVDGPRELEATDYARSRFHELA
jgi:hypothetical protein